MIPFEKSIRFWLIVCVVILGAIAGRIYYPAEKINSPYEEYRYNIDKAAEQRYVLELEKARQYKQYSDNLVRTHEEVVKKLKSEIKDLDQALPLINNTFVGPFVGFSTEGETMFGVGISIPF